PTDLRYNAQLGFTTEDSGFGPPGNVFGWMRTGVVASSGFTDAGVGNCKAWMSGTGTDSGTYVGLNFRWGSTDNVQVANPWSAAAAPCSLSVPVWCVQD